MISLFLSAALAAPVSLVYRSVHDSYRVDRSASELVLRDPPVTLRIPIQDCNRKLVDRFWKEAETRFTELPLAAPKTTDITALVQIGPVKRALISWSPSAISAGRYFRSVSLTFNDLSMKTSQLCRRKPASAETDTVGLVQRANSEVGRSQDDSCTSCLYGYTGFVRTDAQVCVAEICPQGYSGYYKALSSVAWLPVQGEKEKKIVGEISRLFRMQISDKLASYRRLDELLKSGRKIDDPQAVRLINTVRFLSKAFQIPLKEDGSPDLKASREKLPDLSDADFETTVQAAKVIRAAPKESFRVLDESYEFFIQNRSPAEIRKRVAKGLQELESARGDFEKTWAIPLEATFRTMRNNSVKNLKDGKYDRKSLEDLNSDLMSLTIFKAISSDAALMKRLAAGPLDPKKVLGEYAAGTVSSRIDYMKKFLESPPNQSDELGLGYDLKDVTGTCENNLRIANKFSPSAKAREEHAKKVARYKAEFLTAMKKKMSAHSSQALGQESAKWTFAIPETYDDYRDGLLQRLTEDAMDTQTSAAFARQFAVKRPQITAAADIALNVSMETDPEYAKDVIHICRESAPRPLRDHAYLGGTQIALGSYGMIDGAYGEGAAKHEMGHLLSGIFRKGGLSAQSTSWYGSIVTCLKNAKAGVGFEDREEDWADYAASLSGAGVDMCSLLTDTADDFKLKDDDGDSHSTSLYRVMRSYTFDGKSLPASCKTALEAKGEKFEPLACDSKNSAAQ